MEFKLTSAEFAEHIYSQPVQPCSTPLHSKSSAPLHKQLGKVGLCPHVMPGIQTLALSWQVPRNRILLLDEQQPNEAIHISFQLQGCMFTSFTGIRPLDMQTGVHNLVYLTENNGDTHAIAANQQLSVFSLMVDKHFFVQCIEGNNRWSDETINKIEKNLPFAAAEQPLAITPQMHLLIQSIQTDTAPAPMKKLLLHSKILELIALQIAQLSNDDKKERPFFSADDLQKLHVLKAYLDTHFLADLSLALLSRISCLNEFKLKKGFKNCFGETVFGYIRKLRMQYAATILHDTACTVDEVAALLGYEYAHHFSKAFKAHTGYLPTVYRSRK